MNLQDYLREQLNLPVIGRLGASLGIKAVQAAPIADEILPAQLDVLHRLARTPEGAQRLLDLARDRVPSGTVNQLTSSQDGLARLQQAGATLLPEVLGPALPAELTRVATLTRSDEGLVRGLMERLLPLLLGLIAGRAASEKLTPATLGTLFGGAALASGAADGATVATAFSKPEVVIERGAPVSARTAPVTRPVEEESRKRGLGWLWLLPLLLLVLLGGCFLLRGRPVAELSLTSPGSAATVNTGQPAKFTGSGRAGETVTVSENGAAVTTTQVGSDGRYTASVPSPVAGPHTYTISETGTDVTLTRAVTVAAVPATPPVATASPAGTVTSTTLAITAPSSGSTVQAGALTLKGTGPASTNLDITEDGTSLGQTKSDASGAWTFEVPGPATGRHRYQAAAGQASSSLDLTVAAGTAQAGPCTKPFSLSLKTGQSVQQPFRFGGVGSGRNYTVTVSRGARKIGSKVLPLDGSCSYSYTSKPGVGRVTYTLKENGQATVASKITLNVKK
jgi:Bacterial protein of unknown function (DUF937)